VKQKQKRAEPSQSGLSSPRHLINGPTHLQVGYKEEVELHTIIKPLLYSFLSFFCFTLTHFLSSGIPIHTFPSLLILCQICPVPGLVLMSSLFPISIPSQCSHTTHTLCAHHQGEGAQREGRGEHMLWCWPGLFQCPGK